jgi:hypothetical protein
MAIEPQPVQPELPGPGQDTPPVEVPPPDDPMPTPPPPKARSRELGAHQSPKKMSVEISSPLCPA